MCLAIPARVMSVKGDEAEVEVGGVGRRASIVLTPDMLSMSSMKRKQRKPSDCSRR